MEVGERDGDRDGGAGAYTVHEINSACEWKGLDRTVPDVDVPARIVDWLEAWVEAATG